METGKSLISCKDQHLKGFDLKLPYLNLVEEFEIGKSDNFF